jgi:hypothetical protein
MSNPGSAIVVVVDVLEVVEVVVVDVVVVDVVVVVGGAAASGADVSFGHSSGLETVSPVVQTYTV